MKRLTQLTAVLLFAALPLGCTSSGPTSHAVRADEGVMVQPPPAPARLTVGPEQAVHVSSASLGQRAPAIAFGDGVYLLVWQDGFNGVGGQSRILGLRLNTTGKPIDGQPLVIAGGDGVHDSPAVAFCAGRFLVAWSTLRPNGYDIEAAMFGATGDAKPAAVPLGASSSVRHQPAVTSNGKSEFLLVWQEYSDDHFDVRGSRIAAASGVLLDTPSLGVMTRGEPLGVSWASAGRLSAAWTGEGYLVCQSVFATLLGADGKALLPVTRTWTSISAGGSTAAAAWGKGFVFASIRPWSDPWGWGGNGTIVGMTVTAEGGRFEREKFNATIPQTDKNRESFFLADGFVPNCLDASRWFNHPGWPMGMPGALKHAVGDVWPSGTPAVAYDGESLVVVWPRGHMVDNKRMRNRDIYLSRVLPDWGVIDRPAVPVVAGPTEESNPVLCAGPRGQTLLACEKMTDSGVSVCYRLLSQAPDMRPPAIACVVPKSRTEMVVAFDEPIDEASVSRPDNFRIDGLAVKEARFNPDGRAGRREVVVTTDMPQIGRRYTLHVNGVRDRSPAGNATKDLAFTFLAKPGVMQRADNIGRWAVDEPLSMIANPSLVGSRDFICQWNMVGPFPRNLDRPPFDPVAVCPSPGDEVNFGGGSLRWKVIENEAIDLGKHFGDTGNTMVYAATYVYADGKRNAVLRLDSNDHNRAWLNGRLINDGITAARGPRMFHEYSDEIPIVLQNGWNRLLVQVENREGAWLMVGQITDERGQPIRDLTWSTQRPQEMQR